MEEEFAFDIDRWDCFQPGGAFDLAPFDVDEIMARLFCDMHAHARVGAAMEILAPMHRGWTSDVVLMPNTEPKLTTGEISLDYANAVSRAIDDPRVRPYRIHSTIYLTEATTPEWIERAVALGIEAGKLYPAGVTTNSAGGFTDIRVLWRVFAAMERFGMILCLHMETPDPEAHVLNAESKMLRWVRKIAEAFPGLKIVVEHITTKKAVELVRSLGPNVVATITLHHLFLRFQDVIGDKMQAHNFCKPVAKLTPDRAALIRTATSGDPKFMLGTDSAPHAISAKECEACCAGVFTAPVCMPLLVELFVKLGRLQALDAFTALNPARFWGFVPSEERLRLVRGPRKVGLVGNDRYRPFWFGRMLQFSVETV